LPDSVIERDKIVFNDFTQFLVVTAYRHQAVGMGLLKISKACSSKPAGRNGLVGCNKNTVLETEHFNGMFQAVTVGSVSPEIASGRFITVHHNAKLLL
jgi:hypothetical protein